MEVEAARDLARMHSDAKSAVKRVRVAVVSELARWIWAIGLQVQRELEAGGGAE